MDRIAILIPCFNEESAIGSVIEDFSHWLPYADIYVYDNNSTDNTGQIARSYSVDRKVFVKNCPKQGKGNVVKQMLSDIDADIYVLVDGDGTYLGSDVVELVSGCQTGYDMIVGNRMSSSFGKRLIGSRKFHLSGCRFIDKYVKKIYGGDIVDVMSGYKAFTNKFKQGLDIQSKGFDIDPELCIYGLKHGFRIKSVPITYRDRIGDSVSKFNTLMDGLRVLEIILRLR